MWVKGLIELLRALKVGVKKTADFYKYSSCSQGRDSVAYVTYRLRILTHVIEKGLSLPEVKKGFGKEKIEELLELLDQYIELNSYDYDNDAFDCAVSVIEAYVSHATENICDVSYINLERYTNIRGKMQNCGIDYFDSKELKITTGAPFNEFLNGRHSFRKFLEKNLPVELVKQAVELAQTAPSACNRQSVRIIHIQNKEKCKEILKLQGGAKGHSNSEILLITSDLNLYGYIAEMETPYLDGGIFLMNLLYSLTFYGIGTCPLIWNDYGKKREYLRKICSIPMNLHIVAIVQIGFLPDGVCKYANSIKRSIDKVYFSENYFI